MRGDSIIGIVAESLDMTVQKVVQELQTGISITELVTNHDGDLGAIVEAYLTQYQERLDQAVADSRIDQDQADAMMEEMVAHVNEVVQTPWTENLFGPGAPCARPGGVRGGGRQQPDFNNDGTGAQGSGFNSPRGGGQRFAPGSSSAESNSSL
jgi:hypothetical protein